MVKILETPRLRRSEASTYLEQKHGLTVGGGPAFNLFGRYPMYEPGPLDSWAAGKLGRPRTSTSDAG